MHTHARDEGVVEHALLPVSERRELRGERREAEVSAESMPDALELRKKRFDFSQFRFEPLWDVAHGSAKAHDEDVSCHQGL